MEIKLQNLKPVTCEVIWPHILICFAKLSKEQGINFARNFRFSFFSPQQFFFYRIVKKFDLVLKMGEGSFEKTVSLNIQANFQGSICRDRPFLVLE